MKMMKMTSLKLTLLLASLLFAAGPLTAQPKIATIDLKKTFEAYWKTKQADTTLKDRAADLDKARKGMIEDYQKANDDYKKLLDGASDQAVAATERDKRKKTAEAKLLEIKEIENSITQFDRNSRSQLAEQQRRMRDNILREIRDIINAKAKTKGYTLVVDTAADSVNQTPIILFTAGEADISDEVIAQLNANAPVTAPKPDDVKDEKKDEKKK